MSAKALADYTGRVVELIKSDPNISSGDQTAAVRAGLVTYSRLRPLSKTLTQALTASVYAYNLPSDWVRQFSTLTRVEYPTGYQVPEFIGLDEVLVLEEEGAVLTPSHAYHDDNGTPVAMASAIDGSQATNYALTLVAAQDALVIGSTSQFRGVLCDVGSTVNAVASVVTVQVSDGAGGWTAATLVQDDTQAVSGKSLSGDGLIEFTPPSGWATDTYNAVTGRYWVKLTWSSNLTPAVNLVSVDLMPTAAQWRFLFISPAAGESARLTYTVPQRVKNLDSAIYTTVPEADFEAVCLFAGAVCCRQLASFYGQTSSPSISADVVDYQSKTDQYRRLAEAYDKEARRQMGADQQQPPSAAGGYGAWGYKEQGQTRRQIEDYGYRRL